MQSLIRNRMVFAAIAIGMGMSGVFGNAARAQGVGGAEGSTLSLGQLIFRENFDDNVKNAIWRVVADDPDNCWIVEENHRLELRAKPAATEASALYVSNAWRLDPIADFSMKIDLQYAPVTYAKGWVGFGLTPNGDDPSQRQIGVGIGTANQYPHFWYRKVADIAVDVGTGPRLSNAETVYISYNASADELYISDSGYGPDHAWMAFPGMVKGEWGGKPLYLWLGGSASGLTLASGQAILDNLLVESGDVLEASLSNVYRFWSPKLDRHFYTINVAEKERLLTDFQYVWTYEGPAYGAFLDDSDPACRPVYRFWSDRLSGHFYTIDEQEKNNLVSNYPGTWTFEGVAFYAYPVGLQPAWAVPVFRFWSAGKNAHFYTISEPERDNLIDKYDYVWTYEGVAWYAIR